MTNTQKKKTAAQAFAGLIFRRLKPSRALHTGGQLIVSTIEVVDEGDGAVLFCRHRETGNIFKITVEQLPGIPDRWRNQKKEGDA